MCRCVGVLRALSVGAGDEEAPQQGAKETSPAKKPAPARKSAAAPKSTATKIKAKAENKENAAPERDNKEKAAPERDNKPPPRPPSPKKSAPAAPSPKKTRSRVVVAVRSTSFTSDLVPNLLLTPPRCRR